MDTGTADIGFVDIGVADIGTVDIGIGDTGIAGMRGAHVNCLATLLVWSSKLLVGLREAFLQIFPFLNHIFYYNIYYIKNY